MSFGYLPLYSYLIMTIIVAGGLFYYSIKVWNKEPKIFLIGLLILGLSALGGGVNRLAEELLLFKNNLLLIKNFTFWVGVIGTCLIIIGGFQKVKYDPYRKKLALIVFGFLVVIVLLMAILVLYLYSHR